MARRLPISTLALAAIALSAAISVPATWTSAQAPPAFGTALKTPWGEPDLQGIWTDEFDTPFQRSPKYANQEFFTEAQREELDRQRGAHFSDDPRQARGSAADVGGAYNTQFLTIKHAGPRTSMIVDPPDGRVPPQTPDAQRAAAAVAVTGSAPAPSWSDDVSAACHRRTDLLVPLWTARHRHPSVGMKQARAIRPTQHARKEKKNGRRSNQRGEPPR